MFISTNVQWVFTLWVELNQENIEQLPLSVQLEKVKTSATQIEFQFNMK